MFALHNDADRAYNTRIDRGDKYPMLFYNAIIVLSAVATGVLSSIIECENINLSFP